MKKIITLIAVITLSVSAFAREYSHEKGILYKGAPDVYTEKMCRIDVAYEEGGKDRPVIIWFHGGGLTKGKRTPPEALFKDGAVIVGVGYRFVSEVSIPEILDDAAAAVDWTLKNIERYGIDPDKQVAALVPYSGQVITHFAQRRKQGIPELTPTIDHLAPLYFVRGDAAPMLIISGDRELELYGRYEENAYFVRMLRLNGHKNVIFHEVDGFGHSDMKNPAHLLLLKYIKAAE